MGLIMKTRKIISLFFATIFTIYFINNSFVYADDFYSIDYINEQEKEFAVNNYMGNGIDDFKYKIGNIPILISAPHAVKQFRNESYKAADIYTGAIIKILSETTGAHIIYKTSTNGDENYTTEETEYRKKIKELVEENDIRIIFDLHGMISERDSAIDIGTGGNSHTNLLKQSYILQSMGNSLINLNYSVNKYFFGGGPYTLSTYNSQVLGIPSIQLEINRKFRDRDSENFTYMVKTLTEMINDVYNECYKVQVENMKVEEVTTSSIKLSWDKIPGISQYEVYCSTDENNNYKKIETVTDTTYTHSGLKSGQTYYYKIKAVGGEISSLLMASTLCDAPIVKLEANESNTIKVNWSKVYGASGYEILKSTSEDNEYSTIETINNGDTLNFEDKNLTTGKTYSYIVRAYKDINEEKVFGQNSNVVSIMAKLSTTKAIATADEGKINIKWEKVNDANGYEVYKSTTKDGKYSKVNTITNENILSYTNTNLIPGKTYYYKVRAYKNVDENKIVAKYSNIVSAIPKLITPNISLTSAKKKVTIKWKKVNDASGYEIYRATSKNGKYTKAKTITKSSTISCTDSNLASKKNYYYKVRAYKTINGKKIYSSYSAIKTIKTK